MMRVVPALVTALTTTLAALSVGAAAVPRQSTVTPWPVHFTDNLAAQSVTPAATPLEQALLDAIAGAQTTLDVALYDFNRRSIHDALLAATARGVAVRIVGDDEVALTSSGAFEPFFADLVAAGIPIVLDGTSGARCMQPGCAAPLPAASIPAAPLTSRLMHNKYMIVDGQRVWTGSVNMSDTDFTLNQNNAMLIDSPALAALYRHDFEQMIGGRFGTDKSPSLTTTVTISGVVTGVYFSPQDDPIAPIVAEVNAARSSIDFAIFFFTNNDLRDALLAAHARGVRIRGLWDSLGAGDGDSDDEALCAAGIPIKIETARGILHHKLMVIDADGDDPRIVAGSLNWTATATTLNNENTLIVRDRALAAAYTAEFLKMWEFFPEEMRCNKAWLPLVVDERPAPPPPPVQITRIVFNPPGDDLPGESVEIVLTAPGDTPPLALAGWTLRDAATNANVYTFPPTAVLSPSLPLRIWVKVGLDTATDLHWGRTQPVWNNSGDTATLRDATGELVTSCSYPGDGEEVLCAAGVFR